MVMYLATIRLIFVALKEETWLQWSKSYPKHVSFIIMNKYSIGQINDRIKSYLFSNKYYMQSNNAYVSSRTLHKA